MSLAEIRKKIESEYEVDSNGIVQNPGRFENEPLYVVWLADLALEGACDDVLYNEYHQPIDVFDVDDEMRHTFPELGDAEVVTLIVDDQGFFHHQTMSQDELSELRSKLSEQSFSM